MLGTASSPWGRRAASVLVPLLGGWALLAAFDRPSAAQTGSFYAFAPVGDAYVTAAAPRSNTARLKRLAVAAAPVRRAYLRFEVRGMTGQVRRATLRLRALRTSRAGFVVRAIAQQKLVSRRLVYRSAPRPGARVGSSGSFIRGGWASVDVTPAVRANGTVSFALTTTSRRAIALASREAGPRLAPRLEVESLAPPQPGGVPAATSGPPSGDPPPSSPAGTEAPAIAGKAWDRQVLSALPGTWTGTAPIAFSYQWRRCKPGGTGCTDIAGATGATYTLTADDIGATLRVLVTATNGLGSSSATSEATTTIVAAPKPPAGTALPSISGAAQDRQMLKASPGKWAGAAPVALAYQWRRCDKAGAACADIEGATEEAYPVGAVDVGATLRVAVTATNAAASVTATSKQTGVVTPVPPVLSGGVSLWRMDELSGTTMIDSSGRSSGKLKSIVLGQPGLQNTAYRFNGKSSVVVVPAGTRLNPGSSPFTVTVHVAFTQNPSSSVGDYDLIRKGRSDTWGGEYKMEILQNGRGLCAFKGSAGAAAVEAGPNLADGAWHTLQCVKRDSSVSLVIDGKSYTDSGHVGSISNDAPLAIGAKAEGGDWYAGLMDEVGYALN